MRKVFLSLVFVVLAGTAHAEQVTATLNVTVNVQASCMFYEFKEITFGEYSRYSLNALDAMGSVGVRCSDGTTVPQMEISSQDTNVATPRLLGQGASLNYYLYQDEGHTVIWGAGAHRMIASSPPGARGVLFPIYARIPPKQQVARGPYHDMLVITLIF
jgi:spore coat protein U-like protein